MFHAKLLAGFGRHPLHLRQKAGAHLYHEKDGAVHIYRKKGDAVRHK